MSGIAEWVLAFVLRRSVRQSVTNWHVQISTVVVSLDPTDQQLSDFNFQSIFFQSGHLEGWLSSVLASSILQPALEATCILAPLLVDVPERMFLIVGWKENIQCEDITIKGLCSPTLMNFPNLCCKFSLYIDHETMPKRTNINVSSDIRNLLSPKMGGSKSAHPSLKFPRTGHRPLFVPLSNDQRRCRRWNRKGSPLHSLSCLRTVKKQCQTMVIMIKLIILVTIHVASMVIMIIVVIMVISILTRQSHISKITHSCSSLLACDTSKYCCNIQGSKRFHLAWVVGPILPEEVAKTLHHSHRHCAVILLPVRGPVVLYTEKEETCWDGRLRCTGGLPIHWETCRSQHLSSPLAKLLRSPPSLEPGGWNVEGVHLCKVGNPKVKWETRQGGRHT